MGGCCNNHNCEDSKECCICKECKKCGGCCKCKDKKEDSSDTKKMNLSD